MSEQVEFRCPHCEQLYRLSADQLARRAGQTTTCRRCQQPFTFPAIEAPPEQAAGEAAAPEVIEQEPAAEELALAGLSTQQAHRPDQLTFVPPAPGRQRPPARRSGGGLGDFLAFRAMVTPALVQVLFWAGTGVSVAAGILLIVSSFKGTSSVQAGLPLAAGLVLVLFGPILVRVFCELLVTIFRIQETVNEITSTPKEKR